jgi:hypothetical protein
MTNARAIQQQEGPEQARVDRPTGDDPADTQSRIADTFQITFPICKD